MVIKMITSELYHQWLCDLIRIEYGDKRYFLLIRAMNNKQFDWKIPNDDNRAFEGKNLRVHFCEAENIKYHHGSAFISVLEVVVALSIRCNEIMADDNNNMSVGEWFWKLLSNVGLDKFTDEEYEDLGGGLRVGKKIDRIINREYERSGKGGLFPLKYSKHDQRRRELWYQMNDWLVENYY